MTGIQRAAIATAVIGSLAACTNDAASPDSSPPPSETTDQSPATKPPSSSTSTSTTVSTSTSTSSSSPSGASSQQTVVRTDGGSIEVRGNGDVLEVVDITTNEGWEVQVDRPDDRRLVASFTGIGGQSEVTIVLTDHGIQTSTRATN